jgi:hypothetical protein
MEHFHCCLAQQRITGMLSTTYKNTICKHTLLNPIFSLQLHARGLQYICGKFRSIVAGVLVAKMSICRHKTNKNNLDLYCHEKDEG